MDWNIGYAKRGVSRTGYEYDSHYHDNRLNSWKTPGPYGWIIQEEEEKKKRSPLSESQLESLERSFEEEPKLEPNKKMKLSRELGLEPRQIAVWYQNKRARLKAKQIELSYQTLKHDLDQMSKEKEKLQKEIVKLKRKIRENNACGSKQVVTGEDMADETTADSGGSNMSLGTNHHHHHHRLMAYHQCNHISLSPP